MLMESVNLKLKRLREAAHPRVTIRSMADLLGMPHSTYAAYEDSAKFKKAVLPFDLARRIAEILEPKGISRTDVLALAGLTRDLELIAAKVPEAEYTIKIVGEVEAGVWREVSTWPDDDQPEYQVGPPRDAAIERFGLRMVGNSMDKVITPGSILECERVIFGVREPKPGDIVIVERHNHGLVETTCKRLAKEGEEWVLRFESHRPEYQGKEIRLGKPDPELYQDSETRICAVVVSAKLDFSLD